MIMKALRTAIVVTAVALPLLPSPTYAQGGQPSWVISTSAGLTRNCSIPASQLSLQWDAVYSTLRVKTSPTLTDIQKQCLAAAFRNTNVRVDGIPNLRSHFTQPGK